MSRSMSRGGRSIGTLGCLLVLVLSSPGPALGDEVQHPRPGAPAGAFPLIGGDGRAITPPETARSRVTDEGPSVGGSHGPGLDHRSILLDLDRLSAQAPPFNDAALVLEVAPQDEAPGSVVESYHGLQAILVRRLVGYYHEFLGQQLRDHWLRTTMPLEAIEREVLDAGYHERDLSSGGQWWYRSWRESLVPEKGGAPATPRIQEIGKEIELFRVGEVALTTEGKLRMGRLSMYVDDDRIYEKVRPLDIFGSSSTPRARSDAHLARTPGAGLPLDKSTPTPAGVEVRRIDLSIGLGEDDAQVELERALRGTFRERVRSVLHRGPHGRTPAGNLYTGDGWNVSLRPSLQLRIPQMNALEGTVGYAAAQVDFRFFSGSLREPWGAISVRVRSRPKQNDTAASIDLEFLSW